MRRYRGLGARGIAIGWLRGVGGGRATNRLELIVLGPRYVVITPGCAGLGAAANGAAFNGGRPAGGADRGMLHAAAALQRRLAWLLARWGNGPATRVGEQSGRPSD